MLTALLVEPKFYAMPSINDSEPDNPFGRWLEPLMKARGLNQSSLAKAAGLGQSTISSYLSGDRTPQTRAILAQLVRALLPSDASQEYAERIFEQGLRASVGLDLDEEPNTDQHEVIDFLHGQPPAKKDKALAILKAAFAEEDRIDNDGTIGGKRAE